MTTLTDTRRAAVPVASRPGRHDRTFYSSMSVVLALTVLAGFGPTYYLRFFSGGPDATITGGPFTSLIHLHGALFSAWVALFIVQTALIARRRVATHRRLGIAGAFLAAAMVVAGTVTAVRTAARGGAPPGADPLAFLAIPIFDMVLFSLFVILALARRREPEAHKRLMLLAYISIMVAAVARIPGVLALGPPAFFGLTFLFVVAGILYDRFSRGCIHPVYVWGGIVFLASIPLRLAVSTTAIWQSLAGMLAG
jgi:uncharacterized membrane protein YozB (DUF420 family)